MSMEAYQQARNALDDEINEADFDKVRAEIMHSVTGTTEVQNTYNDINDRFPPWTGGERTAETYDTHERTSENVQASGGATVEIAGIGCVPVDVTSRYGMVFTIKPEAGGASVNRAAA